MIIHWNTKNKSFIKMSFYLKEKGLKNNTFFLTLLDPDLEFIDPYDPNLTIKEKAKVLNEIINNYWYFLREVVRIQTPGGSKMYELNPAFLAFHYLSELNISIYFEIARQIGKTTAVLVRKLYTYNFKSRNSKILFFHKTHAESKSNLSELKKIRDSLPSYLKMENIINNNGKKLKSKSSVESIQNVINKNMIITMPSASSEEKADSLGRGKTATEIYFDEHAFMKYNNIVYASVIPAYNTAANISKEHGNPYGIIITTTPGSRNRDYAEYSYQFKESATKWNENFYDIHPNELFNIIDSNKKSKFIYIKYQYYELGYSRKWLENIIVQMNNDWSKIRREYLLEWEYENKNNPFDSSDLEIIDGLKKEPIHTLYYGPHSVYIYEMFDLDYLKKYPPIIGVDVAGSESRGDSSAFTIIDSLTTKVISTFNSNYISYKDLSNIIIDLVFKYYPKAVVNVETNGGFGTAVIEHLKPRIKSNLYWEIVDKVIEERSGLNSTVFKKRMRRYGTNSNASIRGKLISILYNRVEFHKDKFSCPIIISELKTLTTKDKTGKIEHSEGNHDDQIFSYLMALYVWYEGKDLMDKYGITKRTIETDEYANTMDEEIPEVVIDNTDHNLQTKIMNYYSNDEAKVDNTNIVFGDKQFTINNNVNNNIIIPEEYINTSKVYTLENHKLNYYDSDSNENMTNNFYIDNNVDNNKNFWEF